MLEWWSHLRTEWRLQARGSLLWMLAVVGVGLWYLNMQVTKDDMHHGYVLNQLGFLYLGPLSTIAILVSIHGARRDRVAGLDKLLGSTAYSSGSMLTGRFVTTSLPLFLLALLPSAQLLLVGLEAVDTAIRFLAVAIVGMAYACAVGWWLGILIQGQSVYFVGIVVWFLHTYGGFLTIDSYLPTFQGIGNFLMLDLKSSGYLDDFWGMAQDITFWLQRGFYALLLALLLGMMIYVHANRRKEPLAARYVLVSCLFVLLLSTCTMLVGYADIRADRWQQVKALELKVREESARFTEKPAYFQVTTYEMTVSYVQQSTIRVTGVMDIIPLQNNTVQTLAFTLKDFFAFEGVSINGVAVVPVRNQHWLEIPLDTPLMEGKTVRVELSYEGHLKDMRYYKPYGSNPGILLLPVQMATAERLLLTGSYGWYPLPGHHVLQWISSDSSGLWLESKAAGCLITLALVWFSFKKIRNLGKLGESQL